MKWLAEKAEIKYDRMLRITYGSDAKAKRLQYRLQWVLTRWKLTKAENSFVARHRAQNDKRCNPVRVVSKHNTARCCRRVTI